ncbi:hypothetical protein [Cognatiyoonia sp. IB215182]|uniref:hypothetical protein n=1 Tax=Cognatiyoonia sp. IB215182 TaxID=3097353 RepID=UPI002A170508|nr:hypothetical protein [Cognatiyoonia sp. IB215182]MDX8355545.1 hypothetical protein [Cognatiyoonia sp. IB215182]
MDHSDEANAPSAKFQHGGSALNIELVFQDKRMKELPDQALRVFGFSLLVVAL